MKRSPVAFMLSLSLSLGLAMVPLSKTQAQSSSTTNVQMPLPVNSITFEPPGEGKPADTAGGASRGIGCVSRQMPATCVTALMPATQSGLTLAERPTFFVYIPESSGKQVFFSLTNSEGNYQYQTKFPLTQTGGIISFKLPDDAQALKVGESYQWAFIITGPQGLQPDSPGVKGEIKRISASPELNNQLQNAKTLIEQAAVYGKAGIWFDMMVSLAEQKRLEPSDPTLTNAWDKLLTSEGVDATIASKPLL
ncbi:DUF928 domain-containing protein [Ancylothrix sp. C2]|uniref:DUF928 domain-containing protein n=1 Tax=Ancylothrix sp. D3o TaxID=2953691 RepID=UPI0021BB42F3|nr:DUF928 domain-containing protein [Ancylothrix sp. D3o]MCT7950343.1 DUF928 domain-containing protein [Ancylothrix sp. D3o]